AIGALRVLARTGIKVPEDISVIGFDDVHLVEFVFPPLTTVRMSRNDLARGAFDALRAIRETPEKRVPQTISTNLIVRQSTSYPRGSALSKGTIKISRNGEQSDH
ncbi:MAG: substrate-binding domain-containing protein, partial [Silvibacterium sp.]